MASVDIEGILSEVVYQFSDPLAYVRELVQNAIDAGSGSVEMGLRYEDGGAVLEVADFGEGMTREIIEGRLVRLFSSGKDDDLTKIGRFGIGFVSVFAIEPDEVVLETGREGQYWRVVFEGDRTYELYRLSYPVEGTRVVVRKRMAEGEFDGFRGAIRDVARRWCRYAEVPVFLDGEDLSENFDVPSWCTVSFAGEGTRAVMGCAGPGEDFAGYYNRGLTLRELEQSSVRWASYRIDSRYLEHTLTRDQLVEDEGFMKARKILEDLARELPEKLFARMEELAGREELAGEEWEEYQECLRYLENLVEYGAAEGEWESRRLFRTVRSGGVSARGLRTRDSGEEVTLVREAALARQLIDSESKGLMVVVGEHDGAARVLSKTLGRGLVPREEVVADVNAIVSDVGHCSALTRALEQLLRERVEGLEVREGDFHGGLARAGVPWVIAFPGERWVSLEDNVDRRLGALTKGTLVVVDGGSSLNREISRLAETEPELAAVVFLRQIGGDREDLRREKVLAQIAVERREQRMGGRA